MTAPITHFRFCPRCGEPLLAAPAAKSIHCARCGFLYFFNPTISAVALVENSSGEVLVVRRAREPSKGKLGFPGGFIDAGETAETALEREVLEETGLRIRDVRYLVGHPNRYDYGGITYPVLDSFFTARVGGGEIRAEPGEVESVHWAGVGDLNPDDLAFPSLRLGWTSYRAHLSARRERGKAL